MAGFVAGIDRGQTTLLPASLEDYVTEDNPVRAIDAFVDGLDLRKLGFTSIDPLDTGRPGYHPATMLKLYIYGYLNRIPSSRRLERECHRNLELIWLTGKLAPDFKTIADFPKDRYLEPLAQELRNRLVHLRRRRDWNRRDWNRVVITCQVIGGLGCFLMANSPVGCRILPKKDSA